MIVALPLADLAFGSGISALAVGAGKVVLFKIELGGSRSPLTSWKRSSS